MLNTLSEILLSVLNFALPWRNIVRCRILLNLKIFQVLKIGTQPVRKFKKYENLDRFVLGLRCMI